MAFATPAEPDVRLVPKSVPDRFRAPRTIVDMPTTTYGDVLRLPGVARLFVVSFIARIPAAMIGVVLTLHVVTGLGQGYAQAGVVVGAATIGMALGAPWRGRLVDRFGLRRAIAPSVVVESAVWFAAPHLSYEALIAAVFLGGPVPGAGVLRVAAVAVGPGADPAPAARVRPRLRRRRADLHALARRRGAPRHAGDDVGRPDRRRVAHRPRRAPADVGRPADPVRGDGARRRTTRRRAAC